MMTQPFSEAGQGGHPQFALMLAPTRVQTGTAGADTLTGTTAADLLFGDPRDAAFDSEGGAVYRLYRATLGRDPDPQGYAGWTRHLTDATRDLPAISTGFIQSAEFNTIYGTNTLDGDFVGLLYLNVLGRAPSQEELTAWLDLMAAGRTREEVVLGFSQSPEFIINSDTAALRFSTPVLAQDFADDVYRLYGATLGRTPDAAGLAGWADSLAKGRSLAEVATGFIQSQEFQTRYGAADTTQFVTLLYQNVLGRAPDTAGLQGWTDQLNNNALSREQVVLGFSQSAEYIAGTDAAYRGYMAALSTGDRLISGGGNDVLIGGLGPDTFVFNAGDSGEVRVIGLDPWDRIEFSGFGIADPAQFLASGQLVNGTEGATFTYQNLRIIFTDILAAEIAPSVVQMTDPPAVLNPALIYDLGGKFDKGFNEAAFNGAEAWALATGGTYGALEMSTEAQRAQALMRFAEAGYEPVVTVGNNWVSTLDTVALSYTDTSFAIVDATVNQPNVGSYTFAEHEGAYVMGVIAASASASHIVGFIGGMDVPLIRRYMTAFEQGVMATDPNATVLANMTGSTPAAWNDPVRGAELARAQMQQGADVIFTVAGGTSYGVMQQVSDSGRLSIAADIDSTYIHPGSVLTAMVKRVDAVVEHVFTNGITPGAQEWGWAEGGLAYADGTYNSSVMTDAIRAAADAAIADIVSGQVVVTDYLLTGG